MPSGYNVTCIAFQEADNDTTGDAARNAQQSFYELDLGLNHVVRKYTENLEERANFLIAVPGGGDGPSGILICSENYITYKNLGVQPDIRAPIPRRRVSSFKFPCHINIMMYHFCLFIARFWMILNAE